MLKSKMLRYLGKKAIWYAVAFFVALALNFFLPRLIPGNPVDVLVAQMAEGGVASQSLERLYDSFITEFGLDQPLHLQFFSFVTNVLRGDLGTSFMNYPAKVSSMLGQALPYTLAIQIPAIIVGWLLGNGFGAFCAYKGGKVDSVGFTVALFFSSIPFYTLAIILVYLLAVMNPIFPVSGAYSFGNWPGWNWDFISDALYHWILPFSSMVLVSIGGQAIGMREMSLYELTTDYVGYSRALGLKDRKVVGYVFRNAMLPQITGLALAFGTMMGGALVTESVFSYPGVGRLLFTAIRTNDYPMIQGATLLITITVLAANFIVDIVYGFIDPRVRAAQLGER